MTEAVDGCLHTRSLGSSYGKRAGREPLSRGRVIIRGSIDLMANCLSCHHKHSTGVQRLPRLWNIFTSDLYLQAIILMNMTDNMTIKNTPQTTSVVGTRGKRVRIMGVDYKKQWRGVLIRLGSRDNCPADLCVWWSRTLQGTRASGWIGLSLDSRYCCGPETPWHVSATDLQCD
ncbi:hypothetical protein J6590_066828 [Homalodisca vitripennis]|nr:hypothetical protein J6590_066828 [Homalodisca vitripennis]